MNDMFPTSPNEVGCDQVNFTRFGKHPQHMEPNIVLFNIDVLFDRV